MDWVYFMSYNISLLNLWWRVKPLFYFDLFVPEHIYFAKIKKSFQQPDCFSKNEEPFKKLETLISWEVFSRIVIKILFLILRKVKWIYKVLYFLECLHFSDGFNENRGWSICLKKISPKKLILQNYFLCVKWS